MVVHHHVGSWQRGPHGFLGSHHLGQRISRSLACRAICAKRPIPGSSPTPATLRSPSRRIFHDDNFDSGKLNPHWQWNHVPDDTKWSLTEKPGVLRLHSLPATNFWSARNSLCQRPPGPESIMTVELDTTGLVAGDNAGLALLSTPYAWIRRGENRRRARRCRCSKAPVADAAAEVAERLPQASAPTIGPTNPPSHLWLRVHCNFRHRRGHLQLERRWQGIHAAGRSVHHDLPVDDIPRRASRPVQLQHLRPARRLCRL